MKAKKINFFLSKFKGKNLHYLNERCSKCSLVLARCSDLKYEHMLVLARARGFNARTRSVLGILMLDPSLLKRS